MLVSFTVVGLSLPHVDHVLVKQMNEAFLQHPSVINICPGEYWVFCRTGNSRKVAEKSEIIRLGGNHWQLLIHLWFVLTAFSAFKKVASSSMNVPTCVLENIRHYENRWTCFHEIWYRRYGIWGYFKLPPSLIPTWWMSRFLRWAGDDYSHPLHLVNFITRNDVVAHDDAMAPQTPMWRWGFGNGIIFLRKNTRLRTWKCIKLSATPGLREFLIFLQYLSGGVSFLQRQPFRKFYNSICMHWF